MQELITPFRAPVLPATPVSNGWTINPMKVKVMEADEQEEEKSDYFSSEESAQENESPCESPVKNDRFFKHEVIISPGKLKKHACAQQTEILSQILCTEQELAMNSPSKNSQVNRHLIDILKQRRLAKSSERLPLS